MALALAPSRESPEKCALSHGSGVLGRDPRDSCVVAFGALMWKKCAQSHRFGLWRVGGGGDTIGGGSANREPGSYIYIYIYIYLYIHIHIHYTYTYTYTYSYGTRPQNAKQRVCRTPVLGTRFLPPVWHRVHMCSHDKNMQALSEGRCRVMDTAALAQQQQWPPWCYHRTLPSRHIFILGHPVCACLSAGDTW